MKKTCSHWTCDKQVPAKYRYCYEHKPSEGNPVLGIIFVIVILAVFIF